MTQETKETIKFARHWLEVADKHGDPNAPTTGCMTALAKAVVELAKEVEYMTCTGDCIHNCNCITAVELKAELAELKEKYRWRKYEDEPLSMANGNVLLYYKNYEGEGVCVVGDARELEEQYTGIYGITTDGRVYKLKVYWRR